MNDFEVYRFYSALYLHFTKDSYDFFERKGVTNRNVVNFNECSIHERRLFNNISKFDHPKQYLIGNFIFNEKKYIREFNKDFELIYAKYLVNGHYFFKEDINKIDIPIRNIFKKGCNGSINVIKFYHKKKISLFSLCVLEHLNNWTDKIEKDILNVETIKIVKKTHKFFNINNTEYTNIIKQGLK